MFDKILSRMLRAAQLEAALYNEVEADESATNEALIVVVLGALAAAISGVISGNAGLFGAIFGNIVSVLIGWVVSAAIIYFVGVNLFGGTATFGELLRTLGYASSPGILRLLGFIPFLGGLIGFVVWIWTMATNVVAIREALDVDTTKAIIVAIIAVVVGIIVTILIGLLFGGAAMGLGILGGAFR